jgi:transcriptional regulator with XRE-family HTH domain
MVGYPTVPDPHGARFERDFYNCLRERRESLGMSRNELARVCGIHPNTIVTIERGAARPGILALNAMLINLGAVGVSVGREQWEPTYSGQLDMKLIRFYRAKPHPLVISEIASVVRELRRGNGLSLRELSEVAGLHVNTLWSLESGLVASSAATLFKVYSSLGVKKLSLSDERLVYDRGDQGDQGDQ